MRQPFLIALILLSAFLWATVPSSASSQTPSVSVSNFRISPTRIHQNERVNIMFDVENTGQTKVTSVKVKITSSHFSLYKSEIDLGNLSSAQKESVSLGAIVNANAPATSEVTISAFSGSTEIFKGLTYSWSVHPFTFSLSDPSKQRLAKDEVADISFNIRLGGSEPIYLLKFSLFFDEKAFETVQAPKEYSELPAGTVDIPFTIRSKRGAESRSYPINITMFFEDLSGRTSHRFTLAKYVYISWCAYFALLATTGYEPTALALIHFRDEVVGMTRVGKSWLVSFHRIYDPLAPGLTDLIRSNSYFEGAARLLVRPSIHILGLMPQIYSMLSFEPELAVLLSGLLAISLLTMSYVVAPLFVVILTHSYCRELRSAIYIFRDGWLVRFQESVLQGKPIRHENRRCQLPSERCTRLTRTR